MRLSLALFLPILYVPVLSVVPETTAMATTPSLIEITITLPSGETGVVEGKSIAHDRTRCLLMQRDGELKQVNLSQVQSLKQISPTFRPLTVMQVRDRLRSEYRGQLEVTAAGPFVVCAPSGLATPMAELLGDVHEAFQRYFSRRNFDLPSIEFPLVVVVHSSRTEFEKKATADLGAVSETLRGYYSSRTNRTTLYAEPKASSGPRSTTAVQSSAGRGALPGARTAPDPTQTLIHEAIHQLAYNYGLHSRLSETPRWLSEGLAMLMEEESMLLDQGNGTAQQRVNRERLLRFQQYQTAGRAKSILAPFVSSNELFGSLDPLDAYSESWALSFYLAENRPQDYARYLKKVANRDPFVPYTTENRLQDFEEIFGRDISLFEARYLKYISTLELTQSARR